MPATTCLRKEPIRSSSQAITPWLRRALGVSVFVMGATVGGFRIGLLVMIAVGAGTFACILALPAHTLQGRAELMRRIVRRARAREARYFVRNPIRIALQLLALHCMSLNLDEIVQHQQRLRREIVERECILAALNVLRGYAEKGEESALLELCSLVSTLIPAPEKPQPIQTAPPPPPAPAALPPPAPAKRYIHPELEAIGSGFGRTGQLVAWAIARMTEDYTLRDIAALLKREGCNLGNAEISVVLTRMKARGEIEEVIRGGGRNACVYRRPAERVAA